MTKAINIKSIEEATGKSWDEWLRFFDEIGAKDLSHKEIAQKVHEAGTPGWWSQNVTVAYEQHIGRRVPGQQSDGTFAVSVNKTVPGTMDAALDAWLELIKDKKEFNGIEITKEPNISKTEKWRNWRCGLADGTRVLMSTYEKTDDKSGLSLAHEKLQSADDVEKWRAFWKEFFKEL